ncbi:hypothetical protein MLD38_002038 [Melastoma candidum]|uniref:Uncharacterized protein n=1 Tax=Melastoma candidum TaxID=119954 RepID=A0ACB9SF98_9MYRT|nr:hypothetical protein MLD38_002038 [Melastoma candidum]
MSCCKILPQHPLIKEKPAIVRYGPIWISTTLVFVLAALGNCATFLMDKRTDSSTSWSFDVGYITTALWSIYGYAIVVPLGFYFMLKYLGSNASLIQFWVLWGVIRCLSSSPFLVSC